MIDTAIYIGRFQPFHIGHYQNCIKALERAEKLLILIGSSGIGPLPNNPWSFDDRCHMIFKALPEVLHPRIQLLSLYDSLYDQTAWETRVKKLVHEHTPSNASKALVIFAKDDSSFYLDCFPEWQQMHLPMVVDKNNICISATDIRSYIYEHQSIPDHMLVDAVEAIVAHKLENDCFPNLVLANKDLKIAQADQTVMHILVLICEGQVMLHQRQVPLGYQQWALPTWIDRNDMQIFLDKNCTNIVHKDQQAFTSSMLKLPYEVTYASVKQPPQLPQGHQLFSAKMIMEEAIFADHRSILFKTMSLNF